MRLRLVSAILLPIGLAVAAGEAERAKAGQELLRDVRAALAAEQDQPGPARCSLSAPETRPHRAHGKKPHDLFRNLTLANDRVVYNLKYWMNTGTPAGDDPVAIEGSTGLGMDRPGSENWYGNNFLEFRYGDTTVLQTALASFEILTPEGDPAAGQVSWETEDVRVTLRVAMASDTRHLELRLQVHALGAPQPVRLGFRAFPGHFAQPRARRAMTARRELAAPTTVELAADEPALVLFDEADTRTCCGLRRAGPQQVKTELVLGDYAVTVWLDYAPAADIDTGPILLWDLRDTSLNAAMDLVLGGEPRP